MIREGLDLSHPELAKRWKDMPFELQMGNIGSEVSRAVKFKERGEETRMFNAAKRAIELFEFSIDCNGGHYGRMKELCRGKEEFCDYIFGDNTFRTDPAKMIRYYNQFIGLARR